MSLESQRPRSYTKEFSPIPGLCECSFTVCFDESDAVIRATAVDFPSAYAMHSGVGHTEDEAMQSLIVILQTSRRYTESILRATANVNDGTYQTCSKVLALLNNEVDEPTTEPARIFA